MGALSALSPRRRDAIILFAALAAGTASGASAAPQRYSVGIARVLDVTPLGLPDEHTGAGYEPGYLGLAFRLRLRMESMYRGRSPGRPFYATVVAAHDLAFRNPPRLFIVYSRRGRGFEVAQWQHMGQDDSTCLTPEQMAEFGLNHPEGYRPQTDEFCF